MLRIIAGAAKGKPLRTPRVGTRPLTSRAREALFSSLGARVRRSTVLDLYAGSGSLGLEALSRGADSARFVERDKEAAQVLRANVASVGLGGDVVVDDVVAFLEADHAWYDMIFVDPPYADAPGHVDEVLTAAWERLAPGGTLVVHRRTGTREPKLEFPADVDRRRYGDATLYRFHRDAQP